MSKDPALLWYPADYVAGTMGMSFEEKGAYMDLLMMQFSRGHMTSHMIGQTVGQLWDKVQHKFRKDDIGNWYNERIDEEKEKRQRYVNSRKNNKTGKNQYSKKGKKAVGHTTSHMVNVNEDLLSSLKKPKIPDLVEVENYADTRKKGLIDPEVFWAYYDAREWLRKDGTPVRRWKSEFITWEKREEKKLKTSEKTEQEQLF